METPVHAASTRAATDGTPKSRGFGSYKDKMHARQQSTSMSQQSTLPRATSTEQHLTTPQIQAARHLSASPAQTRTRAQYGRKSQLMQRAISMPPSMDEIREATSQDPLPQHAHVEMSTSRAVSTSQQRAADEKEMSTSRKPTTDVATTVDGADSSRSLDTHMSSQPHTITSAPVVDDVSDVESEIDAAPRITDVHEESVEAVAAAAAAVETHVSNEQTSHANDATVTSASPVIVEHE